MNQKTHLAVRGTYGNRTRVHHVQGEAGLPQRQAGPYSEIINNALRITPPTFRQPPACKPSSHPDNRSCWICPSTQLAQGLEPSAHSKINICEAIRDGHEAKQANNLHDENSCMLRPSGRGILCWDHRTDKSSYSSVPLKLFSPSPLISGYNAIC